MKKLLTLFTLATLSMTVVANDELKRADAQVRAFDKLCWSIEDVYISNEGSITLDEQYDYDGDIFTEEYLKAEDAVYDDGFGGIVACAKMKESLKRKGLFYGFFSSSLD